MSGAGGRRHHDKISDEASKNHPDFQLPWIPAILNGPNVTIITETRRIENNGQVANSMFNDTLVHSEGMKARIQLRRPCLEPDSLSGVEDMLIITIGNGLDGKSGRAHGGFSSLVLDHITGTSAARESQSTAPSTAYLHVDYKNPVPTPCVISARAWVTEISGRKVFVKGVLDDGRGTGLATAKALFVMARTEPKSSL
ncbi:hypothetical protein CLAFUW4_14375 [Fulvia fulva]|uniref:Thioesterase domain-containing protein n=1 Tax=Passalora fulva TaxID=5499 RepID=A0A9Q8PMS4_PASFU|nr:uncharacterized protein CLAFUR5_14206 [Fulvia fulva]KAK4609175.1 hypothetical protein CLAFUR4_14371 [Fulvia fulva]KAK4609960.1 hypothetical protein CLAFUR0_14376 [Fulvia fulva]UJO25338.1 hypothetical protein CLAFUR5_14206 [Fulvia fulva]WPV22889.1 hypothetical protein CLAFUW4_14375 [Fulvia fulva]WPV37881.1 hypothetical protein CLAFUW7_14380 [Fulvia fulva]